MSLEVEVRHAKGEVREAIMQFAARRGLRASTPWWLEGVRIEDPGRAPVRKPARIADAGLFAAIVAFLTPPSPGPRMDIELKRRRGRTVATIKLGDHIESVHLAYALRSYLSDERAFACECPPICPRCSASVMNFMARYCGRCGLRLSGGATDDWMPAMETAVPIATPAVRQPVRIERLPEIPPIADPIESTETAVQPALGEAPASQVDQSSDPSAAGSAAALIEPAPHEEIEASPVPEDATTADPENVRAKEPASPVGRRRALAED